LARALINDDLPTFDRPAKATSADDSGSCSTRVAEATKRNLSGADMRGVYERDPASTGDQ
jgi:hypothetical protein